MCQATEREGIRAVHVRSRAGVTRGVSTTMRTRGGETGSDDEGEDGLVVRFGDLRDDGQGDQSRETHGDQDSAQQSAADPP